jgi:type IV secretion system protein VirB8
MSQVALRPVGADEVDAYVAEAMTWEADRAVQRARSERVAWRVATGACVVAALAVTAVIVMLPLKTEKNHIVYVDRVTGNQEVVSVVNTREIASNRELNEKFWARKYVIARESYLYPLLQLDYDTVLALSSDEVGRPYAKAFDGENAKDKRLGPGVEERIKVISVVLPPDQVGKAVIRFEKLVKRVNADQAEPPQTFVATMAFEFRPSMRGREKDLIENPLGFKVTAYRVDAEIASPGGV